MLEVPPVLRKAVLFQDLDDQSLLTLTSLLVRKKFKARHLIFREMDESDALYIVEQGQIVVSKQVSGDVEVVLTRFYPGDFFGEMGLFDAGPRSASARTELDTVLWMLGRKAFEQIFSDHPQMAARVCYRLVAVFIQRLRATNEQAREAIRWGLEATGYSPAKDPAALVDRRST
jgi:CRP/FNR family cyclic AMP-dependent transcriptional regulator